MKARTQAQKLKAKRGRPLKLNADRTPAGAVSRGKASAEALTLEAATWKRRQINPSLTIEEARKPEHGSVIAQWLADWQQIAARSPPDARHPNVFTQLHYDTALRFHELHVRYMSAIAARNPRSATDFGGPGGVDGRDPFAVDIARRHASAEDGYKEARRAILESGPFGMMAVETIILENKPSESLRGDLRQALNRLAVLWRLANAA